MIGRSAARSWAMAAVLAALVAAPGRGEDEVPVGPVGYSPTTLKLRTLAPRRSPWGELLLRWGRLVASSAQAAHVPVELAVDWASDAEDRSLKACRNGKVAGVLATFDALAEAVPELGAFSLPGLFADAAAADAAFERARPLVGKLLADAGLVLTLRAEAGFRQRFETATAPRDTSLWLARIAAWAPEVKRVTLSRHAYEAGALVWCKAWLEMADPALVTVLTRRPGPEVSAVEREGLELMRRFDTDLLVRRWREARVEVVTPKGRDTSGDRAARQAFAESTSDAGRALLALLAR